MDLKTGIRNPAQLLEVIEMVKTATDTTEPTYGDIIWAIHKYKWYNWYQNIHIKIDSPMDIENSKIFEKIRVELPQIHLDVEKNIDYEIEKLNREDLS